MKTLKETRHARGVGYRPFCRDIGIGIAQLSVWETGKHMPNFENVMKLSEGMGLTTAEAFEVAEFRPALELAALKGLIERPGVETNANANGKAK